MDRARGRWRSRTGRRSRSPERRCSSPATRKAIRRHGPHSWPARASDGKAAAAHDTASRMLMTSAGRAWRPGTSAPSRRRAARPAASRHRQASRSASDHGTGLTSPRRTRRESGAPASAAPARPRCCQPRGGEDHGEQLPGRQRRGPSRLLVIDVVIEELDHVALPAQRGQLEPPVGAEQRVQAPLVGRISGLKPGHPRAGKR